MARKNKKDEQLNVSAILNEKIPVKRDGETVKMTAFEASLESLFAKAAKGDVAAAIELVDLWLEYDLIEQEALDDAVGGVLQVPIEVLRAADWSALEAEAKEERHD